MALEFSDTTGTANGDIAKGEWGRFLFDCMNGKGIPGPAGETLRDGDRVVLANDGLVYHERRSVIRLCPDSDPSPEM